MSKWFDRTSYTGVLESWHAANAVSAAWAIERRDMKIFRFAFLAALLTAVLSAQEGSGACTAHGQVVSSRGGRPVSGATITIYPVSPPGSAIKVKSTQDGSFSTEFVVSGFYDINVNHWGFRRSRTLNSG